VWYIVVWYILAAPSTYPAESCHHVNSLSKKRMTIADAEYTFTEMTGYEMVLYVSQGMKEHAECITSDCRLSDLMFSCYSDCCSMPQWASWNRRAAQSKLRDDDDDAALTGA